MSGTTLPETIIDYRVYNDSDMLIGIASVKLPKISYVTKTLKGAGILGEHEVPIIGALKSMEAVINFRLTTASMLSLIECVNHTMEFRSAEQTVDTSSGDRSISNKRVTIQGSPLESDLEKLEEGGGDSSSIKLSVSYLKYVIDGTTLVEIDKLNNVFTINGDDQLADINTALGLS